MTVVRIMSSTLNKSLILRCTNCAAAINIHIVDSGTAEKADENENAAKPLFSLASIQLG